MKISLFNNFGALNSVPVFAAFEQGLRALDIQSNSHDLDADVAVIWSHLWSGRMRHNQAVWKTFRGSGRDVIVLEVGMLQRGRTWKIGLNGVNRCAWFGQGSHSNRAQMLGISLQPWRQGENIVIAVQRSDSEQWSGLPEPNIWVEQTVAKIKSVTNRPIVVRPHPRQRIASISGVTVRQPRPLVNTYDDFDLDTDLANAWCVINENSGPGCQSIIAGVPAFVGTDSLAAPVANLNLLDVEKPWMPDRTAWLEDIAHTEWTTQEIASGLPVQRLLSRLQSC
jgi:hypothetical protein